MPAASSSTSAQRDQIARAYRMSQQCQDAVNLSGIALSFGEVVRALWIEADLFAAGTGQVNRHPVVTLFLPKLMDLNGELSDFGRFGATDTAVAGVRALGDDAIGSEAHRAILPEYLRAANPRV